jgi:peroxiredoxin
MSTLSVGARAPGFSLPKPEGGSLELTVPGKTPTLLAFYKNSCPTCQLTLPFLQRLFERVEGAPLDFWGISQDSAADTRAFGEQYGITFPLGHDAPEYPVSKAYGLTHVPTVILVEPDGSVSRLLVGFSKADLEALASLLHRRFRIPGVTPLFVPTDDVPEVKPG